MCVVRALARYDWTPQQTIFLEGRQHLVVRAPQDQASLRNRGGLFELGPEKGRTDFTWEVRGSQIDPRVLVDFTADEGCAIGSLLPENLGAPDPVRSGHQQRSAFARRHVLGLVETERCRMTD